MIKRDASVLMVIDIQAKLAPAIENVDRIVANTTKLLNVADALGVPILATEQYPKGLGHTIDEIVPLIPDGATIKKEHFCSTSDPKCAAHLDGLARRQVVLTGMEAHICVLQTALDLKARDYEPNIVADAVSSRSLTNHSAAIERARDEGVGIVTTEMVVYEWLEKANNDLFRTVLPLIK
tara:strand:- start:3 stop:542 length:540 start_codon:yes stop_codon:yes gene_type:complete